MSAGRAEAPRAFRLAALRLTSLFAVVFYGADALAELQPQRWRVYLGWELAIPYWPVFYVPYVSVFAMPFLALRLLTADSVRRWERAMALAVLASGVVFVVFPAELGFVRGSAGVWQPLADLARVVSGRYNLLPSLHVALTLITLAAVWAGEAAWMRGLLGLWGAMLLVSVLLTHQHHVADVVAGSLLAWGLVRWQGVGRRG